MFVVGSIYFIQTDLKHRIYFKETEMYLTAHVRCLQFPQSELHFLSKLRK